MTPHSSTLAWKIPWVEEPGRPQSMGSRRVGLNWTTSLLLFTFLHWRRKWQPTPVFWPGESQGRGSLVGCHLWGRTRLKWLSSSSSSSRKFILDEYSVLFYLFMILLDGILSPGQLIRPALMLAIDLSFLLGSFKLNQSDKLSINKKLTSYLLNGKLPQLWHGSTWLTPGYGHLGLPWWLRG